MWKALQMGWVSFNSASKLSTTQCTCYPPNITPHLFSSGESVNFIVTFYNEYVAMYLNPAVMVYIICCQVSCVKFAYVKVIQPLVTDKGVQPRYVIMNVNSYVSKPIFRHLNVTAVL